MLRLGCLNAFSRRGSEFLAADKETYVTQGELIIAIALYYSMPARLRGSSEKLMPLSSCTTPQRNSPTVVSSAWAQKSGLRPDECTRAVRLERHS